MTNKKFCSICNDRVSPDEMKCVFCKHCFHLRCCKLDLNDAVICNDPKKNIHWFCDQCNTFSQTDIMLMIFNKITDMEKSMSDIRIEVSNMSATKEVLLVADKNNFPIQEDSPALNTRKRIVNKRKGAEIDSLVAVPPKKVVPSEIIDANNTAHNKTFRDAVIDLTASTSTVTPADVCEQCPGTSNPPIRSELDAIDSSSLESADDIAPLATVEGLRWIFLSRLKPDTQEIQVTKHLANKLGVRNTDIICKQIVKRGSDADTLSYSSFKIGVKSSLFDTAVLKSTWLPGNIVHEFKPRPKNWKRLPAPSRLK